MDGRSDLSIAQSFIGPYVSLDEGLQLPTS